MNARAISARVRQVTHFHGARAGAQYLAVTALRKAICLEHVYFYELSHRPAAEDAGDDRHTRLATAAEIATLAADPTWDMEELAPADVDHLLETGHRCVLNLLRGRVAGYAWMNPNRIVVPKLRLAMPLDDERVHVYKGFTHPDFRGLRLGNDRFAHWYTQLTEPFGTRVVVDFSFDNPATLARAERSQLRRIGSGTYVARGRFRHCRVTGALAGLERQIIAADLPHRCH